MTARVLKVLNETPGSICLRNDVSLDVMLVDIVISVLLYFSCRGEKGANSVLRAIDG